MQEDMHFYGVYALARAAGIEAHTARTIAHASQFVDDAIDNKAVILSNRQAILPTITSHKPIDYENAIPGDPWRVWLPFHFLPGNEPRSGTFIERMVCRKDSDPARKMLLHTLNPRNHDHWPHLIGIVAHVYADTFSHFGFIGIAHPWNKVKSDSIEASGFHSASIIQYIKTKFEDFKARFAGDFAETIPVGHGPVATYPDRPYLKWRFEYEEGNHGEKDMDRDNVAHFLDRCHGLYDFFSEFSWVDPGIQDISGFRGWEVISDEVKNLLRIEAPRDGRIEAWKEAISSGLFCHVTDTDREMHYDPDLWRLRVGQDILGKGRDSYRFFKAAWLHRNYVLHELFPEIGLLL